MLKVAVPVATLCADLKTISSPLDAPTGRFVKVNVNSVAVVVIGIEFEPMFVVDAKLSDVFA
jgi:hypothetical protein